MARSGDGAPGRDRDGGFNDGSQSGESNNFQGLDRRNVTRKAKTVEQPKPPAYDFSVDIDSLFDPTKATSIADALLQQQYSSAILPFQREMQRGLITPEAFRRAENNLSQQREGLANTYNSTALGEFAKGKLGIQEALAGYKEDPKSLEVGEGLDFNTVLNETLKRRADDFMGTFNDSFYGIHGGQNPFSFIPAQQASLGGMGVTSTSNPIAAALANRDNAQSPRRLGDRVV